MWNDVFFALVLGSAFAIIALLVNLRREQLKEEAAAKKSSSLLMMFISSF